MRRDEKGLEVAAHVHFKYVAADADGTITGWGDTRATLEKGTNDPNSKCFGSEVYTIRQYMKATEGGEE